MQRQDGEGSAARNLNSLFFLPFICTQALVDNARTFAGASFAEPAFIYVDILLPGAEV